MMRLCSGGKHWAASGIASFKLEKLNGVIIGNVCPSVSITKGHRNRDMLPKKQKGNVKQWSKQERELLLVPVNG